MLATHYCENARVGGLGTRSGTGARPQDLLPDLVTYIYRKVTRSIGAGRRRSSNEGNCNENESNPSGRWNPDPADLRRGFRSVEPDSGGRSEISADRRPALGDRQADDCSAHSNAPFRGLGKAAKQTASVGVAADVLKSLWKRRVDAHVVT